MGWVVSTTPPPLYPRERPGTHCTRGWVGPRAGLDGRGKSRPNGIRSPDRPARSESLYRLSYPGRSPITNQMKSFRTLSYHLLKIHFNIIRKSTRFGKTRLPTSSSKQPFSTVTHGKMDSKAGLIHLKIKINLKYT